MPHQLTDRCAIVVGGTAGIGAAIAIELASRGASVTVAGRNGQAGAAVVEQMRAAGGGSRCEYRRLDASSLEETQAFAERCREALGDDALDFLVMCQSVASFGGRRETSEGLELKLTLHAYSRFLLTEELLPSLRLRRGRVLSVLSGGVHAAFTDWSDPDLKTSFSLKRAADAAGFYNDLAFQHLADDAANESVGFLHAAPGFVASSWGHQTRAAGLIKVAQRMFAKSADACAQVMVDAMCDPRYATGFHCISPRGEPASVTSSHGAKNIAAFQEHWQAVRTQALGAEGAAS